MAIKPLKANRFDHSIANWTDLFRPIRALFYALYQSKTQCK